MRIGFPGLRTTSFGLLCSILLAPPPSALADDPIIYPADGQSAEQQRDDEGQCFVWARDESGFDPLAPTEVDKAAAQQRRGGALRGAAAGAIIGAIVDGSDGAGEGAIAGSVFGRMRQSGQNRAARDAQADRVQAQSEAVAAQRDRFDRAYAACLSGRGYTVN